MHLRFYNVNICLGFFRKKVRPYFVAFALFSPQTCGDFDILKKTLSFSPTPDRQIYIQIYP